MVPGQYNGQSVQRSEGEWFQVSTTVSQYNGVKESADILKPVEAVVSRKDVKG